MSFSHTCVVSAGRAILDLLQSEMDPLSHTALDYRVDHEVEELLEADLTERARALVACAWPQHPQDFPTAEELLQEEKAQMPPAQEEENEAVQYITEVLQKADSTYSRHRRSGRPRLSLNHTVLLSLALLSSRHSYRSVSSRFRVEKGNIHRIFFSFCERVNALEIQHIRWPTVEEAEDNLQNFSNFLGNTEVTALPKVLGVLGCTWIPLRGSLGKLEGEEEMFEENVLHRGAHPDSWLNLELVCDSQGKFIYCKISKSSDMDMGSHLQERLKQHPEMLPNGSCLIAALGFPLSGQILTPYTLPGNHKERLYNESLKAHLDILSRSTAELKSRFKRLRYLDVVNFERAKTVVLTACILHNMFLKGGEQFSTNTHKVEMDVMESEGEKTDEGYRKRDFVADLLHRVMERQNGIDVSLLQLEHS